jgi:hypothetical protein
VFPPKKKRAKKIVLGERKTEKEKREPRCTLFQKIFEFLRKETKRKLSVLLPFLASETPRKEKGENGDSRGGKCRSRFSWQMVCHMFKE